MLISAIVIIVVLAIFTWTKPESKGRLVGKLWLLPNRMLCVIELHSTPIFQRLENGNRTFKLIGMEIETDKDTNDVFLVKFSLVYVMVSFGWISY